MQNHLKRHLLCVFMTAMAYNPDKTLMFLNTREVLDQFFSQVFDLTATFKNTYERKVFIIGLSSALNA